MYNRVPSEGTNTQRGRRNKKKKGGGGVEMQMDSSKKKDDACVSVSANSACVGCMPLPTLEAVLFVLVFIR